MSAHAVLPLSGRIAVVTGGSRGIGAASAARLAAAGAPVAVLFLASPASAMTTGHTLPVDGGFLAV